MKRFIIKKKQTNGFLSQRHINNDFRNKKQPSFTEKVIEAPIIAEIIVETNLEDEEKVVNVENQEKEVKDMDTKEKIMAANAILKQENKNVTKVKRVRNDKGLIEKTESSKIILTEDNRELLID